MPDPIEALYVELYARADQLIADVEKAVKTVERRLEGIEQAVEKQETAFGKLGNVIKAVFALKVIQLFAQQLKKVFGFLQQSIGLAARVKVLGTVLQGVGERAGYTAEQIAQIESEVKEMGITTQSARQSLIMMAQAEVDWAYAADLARVSQNAATVAGLNSSEAFERMIYGMSRGRTEIMVTMGLMTNFVKAETEFAAQLGKTRKELTGNERMQARYQETMRAGVAIQDAYTGAMEDAGKQMTSLPRYLEQIQLALGEAFQPAFTTLIFGLKERLGELLKYLQDPATKQALEDFGAALDRFLKQFLKVVDQTAKDTPKIVEFFKKVALAIAVITQETSVAEKTVDNLGTSLKQAATHWWGMTAGQVKFLTEAIAIGAAVLKAWLPVAATWAFLKGEIDWAGWVEATDTGFANLEKRALGFGDTVETAFKDAYLAAGRLLGVIEEAPVVEEPGAPKAPGAPPEVEEEEPFALGEKARKALARGALKIEQALKKFQKAVEKLWKDHAKKIADITAKEQKDTKKAQTKYFQSAEKLQKDYQKKGTKAEQEYNQERIRTQEDFNKQWHRLIRDQHQEVLDADWEFRFQEEHLIAEGDTLALRDLRKRYDHEKEVRAREQEDARTDIQSGTQEQEDERRQAFQESQAEREAEFNESLTDLQTQLDEQLTAITDNANEARIEEQDAMAERMADATEARDEELQKIAEWLVNVKDVSDEELQEIKRIWAAVYGEIADNAIEEGLRAHEERMNQLNREMAAAQELQAAYEGTYAEATAAQRTGEYGAGTWPRRRRTYPESRIPIGAQHGLDAVFNRPTTIMVGEGGMPEHVQVTPLSGGGGGGRVNVHLSGSIAVTGEALSPEAASNMIVVVADAIKQGVRDKMEAGL